MRIYLAAALMSLTPLSAMAVVADDFSCNVWRSRADGSVESEISAHITGIRLPESPVESTPKNVRYTYGYTHRVRLSMPGSEMDVDFGLRYRHALERGVAAGTTPRAAESLCLSGTASFPATVDYGVSSASRDSCTGKGDRTDTPFDPNDRYWNATAVVDGVPKISNTWIDITINEPDYTQGFRKVRINCQNMRTFP